MNCNSVGKTFKSEKVKKSCHQLESCRKVKCEKEYKEMMEQQKRTKPILKKLDKAFRDCEKSLKKSKQKNVSLKSFECSMKKLTKREKKELDEMGKKESKFMNCGNNKCEKEFKLYSKSMEELYLKKVNKK